MPKRRSAQDNNDMSDLDQAAQAPESALEEGKVFDYITGNPVKDSDKEQVVSALPAPSFMSTALLPKTWSLTSRLRCRVRTAS